MKFIITEEEKDSILKMYLSEYDYNTPQTDQDKEFNTTLEQVGITLTPEEKKEIQPECELEVPSQYEEIVNQINAKIEGMDKNQLVQLLKTITPLKKQVNEQIAPVIIAGVSVPGVAIAVVVGIVIVLILIKLSKLIFGKRGNYSSCRNRYRLMDKFVGDLR